MNILDILQPYADRPTDTNADFDEAAPQLPRDVLGDGISHAFRSDRTPAFGDMVGSLFGGSSGTQRSGLIEQLIRAAGPAVLAGLSGGGLGRLLQGLQKGSGSASISPADAERLDPRDVRDLANAAQKQDPGVLDKVAAYYAAHPEVVKALGGAALAIALGQMANRMKR